MAQRGQKLPELPAGARVLGCNYDTGERYLPKDVREALTDEEYARTTAKKRADTRAGKQFSAQPKDVAQKAAELRLHSLSRAELLKRAAERGIPYQRLIREAIEKAL